MLCEIGSYFFLLYTNDIFVSFCTHLLKIKTGHRVLEFGYGEYFTLAHLFRSGLDVIVVEGFEYTLHKAVDRVASQGLNTNPLCQCELVAYI